MSSGKYVQSGHELSFKLVYISSNR